MPDGCVQSTIWLGLLQATYEPLQFVTVEHKVVDVQQPAGTFPRAGQVMG